MKSNDYINVQAPMIADLNLIGKNELLLFAMIHGYTKDGKSTCRVSLGYMMKWLKTSKSAVIRTLNDLEEAGYINRFKYKEGNVECVEYTTNYEALLERAANGEYISLETAKKARGLKMRPASECVPSGGSQNEIGLKMITKGSQNDNETGLKMRPNNNNIIIYNNFYCAEQAQQEEEKKSFYKLFFWKNAADPAAEVEKFIDYNNSLQWRNDKGRVYETPEQRLSLAGLWQFKTEGQWARADYLKALKSIVNDSPSDSGVEVLINHKVNLVWDGRQNKWFWKATAEARMWIERNKNLVHKYLDPVTKGKIVTWDMAS